MSTWDWAHGEAQSLKHKQLFLCNFHVIAFRNKGRVGLKGRAREQLVQKQFLSSASRAHPRRFPFPPLSVRICANRMSYKKKV